MSSPNALYGTEMTQRHLFSKGSVHSFDSVIDSEESSSWLSSVFPRGLPVKTALLAFFLFFVGVVFGFSGMGLLLTEGLTKALPFFIISGITFIPGAYHTAIIFLAWRKYKGFSYDQIPSFK